MSSPFVVCESTAAITTHLRELALAPENLGGHPEPRPQALCGAEVAWDTRLPLSAARCRACLVVRALW